MIVKKISLAMTLAIFLTGCGRPDPGEDWVGAWRVDQVNGISIDASIDADVLINFWTFAGDGTWSWQLTLAAAPGFLLESVAWGTYSVDADGYALTQLGHDLKVNPAHLDPGNLSGMAIIAEQGVWILDGDRLYLNSRGNAIVLRRV